MNKKTIITALIRLKQAHTDSRRFLCSIQKLRITLRIVLKNIKV